MDRSVGRPFRFIVFEFESHDKSSLSKIDRDRHFVRRRRRGLSGGGGAFEGRAFRLKSFDERFRIVCFYRKYVHACSERDNCACPRQRAFLDDFSSNTIVQNEKPREIKKRQ